MRAAAIGAVAFLISLSAASQEDGKRVPEGRPTPQSQTAAKSGTDKDAADKPPLLVRMVQSADEAAISAAKEAKSDKRQDDDLIAQQSAASAAWAQAAVGREQVRIGDAANNYALWAAIASGISAFLLAATVYFSWQSADAARQTLRLEQSMHAPLLVIERVELLYGGLHEPGSDNVVEVWFRNFGRTPAATRLLRAYYFSGAVEPTRVDWDGAVEKPEHIVVTPGDAKCIKCTPAQLSREQFAGWDSKTIPLFLVGEVAYRGTGGVERAATFCWRYPFRGEIANHDRFNFTANPENPLNHLRA